MKVTMIIGEPATGKSTVMKEFMSQLENWTFETPKYVPHHISFREGTMIVVLGRYDDLNHQFPGTDRMSMAAQPEVLKFLSARKDQDVSVFFEGDRLGNRSMIEALQKMDVDLQVVRLIINSDVACWRKRPSQTDKFRASRLTKMKNLFDINKMVFVNNTEEHCQQIVNWLIENRL